MIVLDASAVLALINDEPGGDDVAVALSTAALSAVNLAEVVGKLVDVGADAGRARALLVAAGVTIEPLTAEDAELAGALRAVDGGSGLSLGDRCCLALAARDPSGEVMTADHAWTLLSLPVRVRLIR